MKGGIKVNERERMKCYAKWTIGVVTACIMIFLCTRHINNIATAVVWSVDLFKPVLIGIIFALILNVPMSYVEEHILKNLKNAKYKRPLAIFFSLILVAGMFIGIAVVVVPELIEAVRLIVQIINGGLDQLAAFDSSANQIQVLEKYFSELDVDWLGVKKQLEEWIVLQKDAFMDYAVEIAGSAVGDVITCFIGFVFSIYILAQKENLKKQACRFVRVWLPCKLAETLIHIADVGGKTFKLFIAGQATEAVILGLLCLIGMLILRIPYAPIVAALIGVTALVPLVGAYVGTIVGAIIILTANPFKAFVFIIFIIILQQVEGNAIYPRTVGAKIKLPALWVLVAIVIGGKLAGPLGMLLCVPATSATFALLKEATDKREIMQKNKVN